MTPPPKSPRVTVIFDVSTVTSFAGVFRSMGACGIAEGASCPAAAGPSGTVRVSPSCFCVCAVCGCEPCACVACCGVFGEKRYCQANRITIDTTMAISARFSIMPPNYLEH